MPRFTMAVGTGRDRELRRTLTRAHEGQTLRGIDFSEAALDSVAPRGVLRLDRCLFVGTDLRHATLEGCHFKLCDLGRADFRGASLRGASFDGCVLSGADFRGADLFDVSFGSVGVGAGATRTLLDGARFDAGALRSARVDGGMETPPS